MAYLLILSYWLYKFSGGARLKKGDSDCTVQIGKREFFRLLIYKLLNRLASEVAKGFKNCYFELVV